MRVAVVEVRELQQVVKVFRSRRREGGVFRVLLANPLPTDVDVPRQALVRLAADDPIQRIVLVLGHRDAKLDVPVIVGDVRGDLGLRVPTEPRIARGGAIEIGDRSGRVDRELVVGS